MKMLSWKRMYALMVRHALPLKRDFDLLSDMIYWPLVDTFTWGLATEWFSSTGSDTTQLVLSVLVAIVVWNVIWRSQAEVSRNLIDEMWNNNLINMFSSPLTLAEWIGSVLLQSIIKMFGSVAVISAVMLGLYAVNVFSIGWWIVAFFVSAVITGWATGFLAAAIVIRYGPKMQTVVWTLPGVLWPLSAVFFPVEQLPHALQYVSYAIPTTYIFEAMRALVFEGSIPTQYIWFSYGLGIVYLALAIWLFVGRFKKSKELNLARFNN